jgi:hypothetical protein
MNSFSELIQQLLIDQNVVTIGSGENELRGTITSFDKEYSVIAFTDQQPNGLKHYIPLTSIRSFGVIESGGGLTCYLDLFKR